MLKERVEKELNKQVNEELFSAYIYLSMVAYFEDKNLAGFAAWMKAQVQEELFHAQKIFSYISERQGRAVLEAIGKPPVEWDSPLAVFEAAYKHEVHISERINLLVTVASEEKDNATYNFLQWFVSEQVEEESSVDAVVQKLKMVGDYGPGIFLLDQELGLRVFTPPPTAGAA